MPERMSKCANELQLKMKEIKPELKEIIPGLILKPMREASLIEEVILRSSLLLLELTSPDSKPTLHCLTHSNSATLRTSIYK